MRIRWNTVREAAPLGAGLLALVLTLHPACVAAQPAAAKPADVVVHASDLPSSALSEFRVAKEAGTAGGLVFTPQGGDELDPPPENDPHVTIKANVQAGVPYRLWIHMKVGAPKGKSKANLLFAQFTGAVDAAGKETLSPRTGSYLSMHGPAKPGWVWVGSDAAKLITFKSGGEITIRLQGGAEGVGFDQVILSPARFLEKAPTDAVVAK